VKKNYEASKYAVFSSSGPDEIKRLKYSGNGSITYLFCFQTLKIKLHVHGTVILPMVCVVMKCVQYSKEHELQVFGGTVHSKKLHNLHSLPSF